MIAARLPVTSARDDAIAVNEDSPNSGIRARFSQPFLRLGEGGSHEFFVHVRWRHELKV